MTDQKPTAEQHRIINHQSGHAKVIAVPGSGKTSTLVRRVVELISRGVNPTSIKVLAFNTAAVADFRKKLSEYRTDIDVNKLVLTHHAFAKKLIETHRAYDADWTFDGESKSSRLLMVTAARSVNTARPNHGFVADALNWVSLIKANGQSFEEGLHELSTLRSDRVDCNDLAEVVRTFESLRISQRKRFQDDLTPDALGIISRSKGDQQTLAHLIVDEYQDINEVQHRLLLASSHAADVMVVGDPNQCIYQWRGSQPTFITDRFVKDFANTASYTLSRSFRLGHHAALCANALISQSATLDHRSLCIAANNAPFGEVKAISTARELVEDIKSIEQHLRPYSQVAVLARRWSDLVSVQLEMVCQEVPFRLDNNDKGLINEKTIRFLLSILAFAATDRDTRHADERSAILSGFTEYLGISKNLLVASIEIRESSWVAVFLRALRDHFRERSDVITKRVAACLCDCVAAGPNSLAVELIGSKAIRDLVARESSRERIIEVKDNATDIYRSIVDLVATRTWTVREAFRILMDVTSEDSRASNSTSSDKVTLTTIHGGKGREWPFVAIVTPVNEARVTEGESLEEERNIWYVGITRAIEGAWILNQAGSRFVREMQVSSGAQIVNAMCTNAVMPKLGTGSYGRMVRMYLGEVERTDLFERQCADSRSARSSPPVAASISLVPGDIVAHPRLGSCTVVEILDSGRKARLRPDAGDELLIVISIALSSGMKLSYHTAD